ncbi:hypothetical protein B0T24DRAFT_591999 [Lasiosphaeria ovina]|uniref:FAD-binding PCMH-type domain-containing protein n=1 Tax=Lasiosphaeria ovina TaxID=92902 RepID=A0AAE0KGE8_9PEZI|nr:hypothetical protein B0T24DRAFT_591999 [Lasiosphaeria ovina]
MLTSTLLLAALSWAATRAQPDIETELGALLSDKAMVIAPSSPHFGESTERYLRSNSLEYAVVVVVDTEDDVSQAVQGGLATMHGGMNIWLWNLSRIEIALDGQHAYVGAALCQCVGVAGSSIGGGVGVFMGSYCLGPDQIVSARVVLANGTAVTASPEPHADLLWALKGAGHNFGIVTELQLRVFDNTGKTDWSSALLVFTQDKLEALFRQLNAQLPRQPSHLSFDVLIVRDPSADAENSIILVRLFSNVFSVTTLEDLKGPRISFGI